MSAASLRRVLRLTSVGVFLAVSLMSCQLGPSPLPHDDPPWEDPTPPAPGPISHTVLVAGQSNAVGWGEPLIVDAGIPQVRMFGNDYRWRQATEPLDDATDQVDLVSLDDTTRVSFGLALGRALFNATGLDVFLIPSAKGASATTDWFPAANPLNRDTLFGSANYRAQVSAGWVDTEYEAEGGPVTALVWYQGEADAALRGDRDAFIDRSNIVMDAFDAALDVPILFVQLGPHQNHDANERQQVIREHQRRMESGAVVDVGSGSTVPRARFHMVVAHDLPLSDDIHLSANGQRILGERLALAYRQHVLGEAVNGTGPRLVSITQPTSTTVKVATTRTINDHPTYDGYLSVQDTGAPPLQIVALGRDPDDPHSVLITLDRATVGDVSVRYMPPGRPPSDQPFVNAVRDADGLPLPAFGTHGVE